MNAITVKGYFNAGTVSMEKLNYADNEYEFSVDVSGGKRVSAIFDIPAEALGTHKLICVGVMGFPNKEIYLTPGKLNVIPIDTLGYTDDGVATFIFVSGNGSVAALNVKAGFIKHIDSINN